MNKRRVTALVTAVGGRSIGYQIFECLRKFPNNYKIVTTDKDPFSPGLYEADRGYLLPSVSSKNYLPTLIKICKKEKVDVVLPGSVPETLEIAKYEKELLKEDIVPITNSYPLVKETYDKLDLYNLLKKNGILTPETHEIKSLYDAPRLSFPLIVKPRGETSGSRNVSILKDLNELSETLKRFKQEGLKMLAQEYVSDEDHEYTVGVICGRNGRIIDTIVMRRRLIGLSRGEERTIDSKNYVLSTGYSQGFFVEAPEVKKYCEFVAKKLGARGPFNIQCRTDKKKVYIFEVHPRFSGSASMRAEMGFNEPHILIRDFLDLESVTKINYKTGYAVIRKFANTVVAMENYRKVKRV